MSLGPAYGKSEPNTVRIGGDYQVLASDDLIISNGGNTITLPLFVNARKPIEIKSEGVEDDLIDGNGSTVPNTTSLTPTQSRIFAPDETEWVEL